MENTIDTKAAARSTLAQLAESLREEAVVKYYNDLIRNGEEGIMDFICEVTEALHDLNEEFVAWAETCDGDQQKCKARQLLRAVAEYLVEPLPEQLYEEGAYETWMDVVQNLYIHNDDPTCEMLGCVVSAVHDLRSEIIAGAERWSASAARG